MALWQTRLKDELARQDSPVIFNQVGLLDEVKTKTKILSALMYNSYGNTDLQLLFSIQTDVISVSF